MASKAAVAVDGLQARYVELFQALAKGQGAETSSSVTKKVTDVVIGAQAGTKAAKARARGLALHGEGAVGAGVGRHFQLFHLRLANVAGLV